MIGFAVNLMALNGHRYVALLTHEPYKTLQGIPVLFRNIHIDETNGRPAKNNQRHRKRLA
jgi:hypothetical protein